MAKSITWISYVEAFVDTSRPSNQQVASIDALASLLKKDVLTIETLIGEMELYLTTSDNVIRARGVLLLGEILTRLISKPLDSVVISSLTGFFKSRLLDWQALRGALIGCLALLRRKKNVGMATDADARLLAQSFLLDLHVQSLTVQDRKLCYEILQCLLDFYHDAIIPMGGKLIYQICEAIDEERDPRCLMLTFHIVETVVQLIPDVSGPVTSFAVDIFEILGRYFPIDFTHPSDDFDLKKDDLSNALMQAFCATPYFEPFAVPLLLDKLSSSLESAKLDSLEYLNNCILRYGVDRMLKHAKNIWSSLKDVIFSHPPQGPLLSPVSDFAGDVGSQESQILKKALICLRTAISQLNCPNNDLFLSLVLDDDHSEMVLASLIGEKDYPGASRESHHQLKSLGSILSVASMVSSNSCSSVFQKVFHRLMDALGVSAITSSRRCIKNDGLLSKKLNFGALYLCVELLSSCRDLTIADLYQQPMSLQNSWGYLVETFSCPLTYALGSILATPGTSIVNEKAHPEYFFYSVRGLQVLATFPDCYSPISKDLYDDILVILMSVITDQSEDTFLWKVTLKELVQIGSFVNKCLDSTKGISYNKIVVERLKSLLPVDDSNLSLAQKLEAMYEIGTIGMNFMSSMNRALEEIMFSNFSKACVEGNHEAAEFLVPLLDYYNKKVLPWCSTSGNFEAAAMDFAVNIWNQIENATTLDSDSKERGLLDLTMMTMKLIVGDCTVENQSLIVQKAYKVLSSTSFSSMVSVPFNSSKLEGLQYVHSVAELSCRDVWILSLFASVVIALRPQTPLPNARILFHLFMVFLHSGHIPAVHALASIINKFPEKSKTDPSVVFTLEEAIELIFEWSLSSVLPSNSSRILSLVDTNEKSFSHVSLSTLQIHAVVGLAWIGKGLLMRGHEKVKNITMLLVKCILVSQNMKSVPLHQDQSGNRSAHSVHHHLARSSADAFHIFLSDSEFCLNKKFHAIIKPLYKQRFFSSVMPILVSLTKEYDSSCSRAVLYEAVGHVISNSPLAAVVTDAKKVIPLLLDSFSVLSLDIQNKDLLYSILLVLAGILMDENGKDTILENAHTMTSHLLELVSYPYMMLVRETAIQCLVAMSGLPHTRIYPLRPQVLTAVSKALDDRKRIVRLEAAKCRQAWASIASRSLHF